MRYVTGASHPIHTRGETRISTHVCQARDERPSLSSAVISRSEDEVKRQQHGKKRIGLTTPATERTGDHGGDRNVEETPGNRRHKEMNCRTSDRSRFSLPSSLSSYMYLCVYGDHHWPCHHTGFICLWGGDIPTVGSDV